MKQVFSKNSELDNLSSWQEKLFVQVVSHSSEDNSLLAVSQIVAAAAALDMPVEMAGTADTWFLPKGRVIQPTNYMVAFTSTLDQLDFEGKPIVTVPGVDLSDVGEGVRKALSAGVVKHAKGCFSAIEIDDNNVISGFVAVVSRSLTEIEQRHCLEFVVPISFGIIPVITSCKVIETVNPHPPFFEKSQLIQLYNAIRYCRVVLDNHSRSCPSMVLSVVYQSHGILFQTDR
nr:hypothetical protein [uncultured Shimia sp.]